MITATGLGSGLDISGLVAQLVATERAGPDLQLSRESARLKANLSAFGSLKSAISGLQGSLGGLNVLDSFGRKSVTSSVDTAVNATATNSAIPNTYSIEVSSLAEGHALASPAWADSDSTSIGTGTLTFRFGTTGYDSQTGSYSGFVLDPDSETATITIDSNNNTLTGIMTTINDGKFGVRASIVNDGSGYRLLMSSEKTGEKSSLEISVLDGDGNDTDGGAAGGLSAFAFNSQATHMTQTAAAANAVFKINGLTVSSQENTTTTAIDGLTLSLKEVTGSPVIVQVAEDTSAVVSAFDSFIKSYNQFRTTINTLTDYNPATNTAGTLLGDFTVRSVVGQVENVLRNNVAGVDGTYTNLAELGLKTTASGGYELDTAKFKKALVAEPQTVSRLFAALGVPTDSAITYASASSRTAVGNYTVNIISPATAGSNGGAGVLPDFSLGETLLIDDDNDNLSLTIDGLAIGDVTLTHGIYTDGDDLASELQARINGTSAMREGGKAVSVQFNAAAGNLTIQSDTFGSSSVISIDAVDAGTAATLGFSIGTGTTGSDVAGTINGAAASGAGQLLTASAPTGAAGLAVMVSGTATGERGTVNFTRGVADQLKLLLGRVLEAEGSLDKRIDNIEAKQEAVEARKARLELKWKAVETRYLAQFNALDGLLSQLESTSSYLETQFESLVKPVSSRSRR